jgi:hypothetical protein
VPANPSQAELGPNGTDRYDGFFQIDLNYLPDTGTEAVATQYEAIRDSFHEQALTEGDQYVHIRSCGRSQGRIVDNYFRVTLTVFWYAFVNRLSN